MSSSILLRNARQLLTLHGPPEARRGAELRNLEIIQDGALLIENGHITEIGSTRRVENLVQARNAREIDATGQIVMPGFVDCHTHLVCGSTSLGGQNGMAAVHGESTRRMGARARQIVHGMVRHGTTTVEAKSGYGLDAATELKTLRALRDLHQNPIDIVSTVLTPRVPPTHERDTDALLEWACTELLARVKRRGWARFADFSCAERIFTVAQCRRYLETARGLGFLLKVHADGPQPGAYAAVGVSLEAASVDHLEDAGADAVELLARARTIAVLLPAKSLNPGRLAPARQFIDAGAAVALGTNCDPVCSPGYSMQTVVALACACLGMTPAEAICAATFNAACAIGCGHQTGSLEVGKIGDVIVLDAADYREIPSRLGVNQVRTTIKRGAIVYQQGKVGADSRPALV